MSARLLYAHFPAASHRSALEWMRVVAEIASGHPGVGPFASGQEPLPALEPAVAWRLVSENRREIARGCRVFTDEGRAASIWRSLCARHRRSRSTPVRRPVCAAPWFVSARGSLVMMGARRYEKRSAAESAAALAVRLMQELAATSSGGALEAQPAGAGGSADPAMSDGLIAGRFHLRNLRGSGGTAAVFEADDTRARRAWREAAASASGRRTGRLGGVLRGGASCAGDRAPNIAEVYDAGLAPGDPPVAWIAMELVEVSVSPTTYESAGH
jgi:hypothetical protein